MATNLALKTQDLTKAFRGKLAVDRVSLTVRRGEIVGFLGPNGAGKTTLMNMVMGLLTPDAGDIELLGVRHGARDKSVLMRIGFLQEKPRIYPEMTARAYLEFHARLYGLPNVAARCRDALDRVGLSGVSERQIGTFSRGMQQRICLARVMLHRPELLILDEPTLGLDPEGVAEMRAIFRDMQQAGTTLLFSSHQLAEMERICDSVIFMRGGRLVAAGAPATLLPRGAEGLVLSVETAEDLTAALPAIEALAGIVAVRQTGPHRCDIVFDPAKDHDERNLRAMVARHIAGSGLTVLSVMPAHPSLEDLFLALASGGRAQQTRPATAYHQIEGA